MKDAAIVHAGHESAQPSVFGRTDVLAAALHSPSLTDPYVVVANDWQTSLKLPEQLA